MLLDDKNIVKHTDSCKGAIIYNKWCLNEP